MISTRLGRIDSAIYNTLLATTLVARVVTLIKRTPFVPLEWIYFVFGFVLNSVCSVALKLYTQKEVLLEIIKGTL